MTRFTPCDRNPNGHYDDRSPLVSIGHNFLGEQEQRSVLRDSLRADPGLFDVPRPMFGRVERDELCW